MKLRDLSLLALLFMLALVAALVVIWPFAVIWALNTLGASIAYTFWTWLAAFVLIIVVTARVTHSK